MRGGWLHNQMVAHLAGVLRGAGAWVRVEHPIRVADSTLLADLYAGLGRRTLLVEVERTPDRVSKDLVKAEAVGATWCVIVTPTAAGARAVRRKLGIQSPPRPRLQFGIVVWPYGVALQRLIELLSFDDFPHTSADIKTSNRSSSVENVRQVPSGPVR